MFIRYSGSNFTINVLHSRKSLFTKVRFTTLGKYDLGKNVIKLAFHFKISWQQIFINCKYGPKNTKKNYYYFSENSIKKCLHLFGLGIISFFSEIVLKILEEAEL